TEKGGVVIHIQVEFESGGFGACLFTDQKQKDKRRMKKPHSRRHTQRSKREIARIKNELLRLMLLFPVTL
ncbi:MAG: hypothetical protein B7W96_00290, partial [Parcubacteria group bacterium 37-58-5]